MSMFLNIVMEKLSIYKMLILNGLTKRFNGVHAVENISFKVFDGTDLSESIFTLSINILPINDSPTFQDIENQIIDEDTFLDIEILVNDIDNTNLNISISEIDNGTISIENNFPRSWPEKVSQVSPCKSSAVDSMSPGTPQSQASKDCQICSGKPETKIKRQFANNPTIEIRQTMRAGLASQAGQPSWAAELGS